MDEQKLADAFVGIVAIALFIAVAFELPRSISASERAECMQWRQEASVYKAAYYLTHWQKEQCDRFHVAIDAPVK